MPLTVRIADEETICGLSVDRLERVSHYVQRQVDNGLVPMMQLIVARRGNVVLSTSSGLADVERQMALTDQTIMRMKSMTKPIVTVAVMILVERTELQLDDLVSKHLPCFANPRVFSHVDESGTVVTREPIRPMTIQHLPSLCV